MSSNDMLTLGTRWVFLALYLAVPGFTWSTMIYLTTDCHTLPLTGLNTCVYTGLNAQTLLWMGMGWEWKAL